MEAAYAAYAVHYNNEAAYAAYAVHYGKMKQELMPSNALRMCTIVK